jgi:hypothetical protein
MAFQNTCPLCRRALNLLNFCSDCDPHHTVFKAAKRDPYGTFYADALVNACNILNAGWTTPSGLLFVSETLPASLTAVLSKLTDDPRFVKYAADAVKATTEFWASRLSDGTWDKAASASIKSLTIVLDWKRPLYAGAVNVCWAVVIVCFPTAFTNTPFLLSSLPRPTF